jgi:hypothetical protein
MEPAPEALTTRFAQVLDAFPAASRKQMFGYPCAFAEGRMFTAVFGSGWVVRLPDAEREAALALDGARPFEPMPGRPMREYVMLPPDVVDDDERLLPWLRRGWDYALSLPPKPPKPPRRRKPASTSPAGA